jgi:hypothetical protein
VNSTSEKTDDQALEKLNLDLEKLQLTAENNQLLLNKVLINQDIIINLIYDCHKDKVKKEGIKSKIKKDSSIQSIEKIIEARKMSLVKKERNFNSESALKKDEQRWKVDIMYECNKKILESSNNVLCTMTKSVCTYESCPKRKK